MAVILVAARAFGVGTWSGKGNMIALPFIVFMISLSQIMGRDAVHPWIWVAGGAAIAAAGGSLIGRVVR
ncbi:hypothetical protein [Sphingomonas sanguinis]|jgi:hypothetical protein|uniref:Uncharacterized protein n=2 Tax=Sphingomonas sanguinis TaxID=33051 RepID=A0A7Y7QT41_9SPHN|nr:hypothetical protein [Sphingomonas sanguinis]MBZ6380858.1 hypothetical protein [Sphingomonas sanguinis]NNG53491.1 hypothetical protein [Sphingomonas sanguinis]NVP30160.1 hypothetical protein [Sphingomonas sanguinis]